MHPLRQIAAAALLVVTFGAQAQWTEGVHYEVLTNVPELPAGDTIQVLEAFWYGCPSCYNLEPHIQRWLATKPDDVEFVRIAASMAPSWRVHARAFYTADALDVVDEVHVALFNAIHLQRNPLNTVDAIAAVFEEHAGVDHEAVTTAYRSFDVDTRMRRGDQETRRYRLGAVPTVIVAGKYRTDPGRAQGFGNVMRVVDHLVELERRARSAQPEVR